MTKIDNPQKAIEALGAVEVAPGRYAYQDHFGFWYTFPEARLASMPDGYSQAIALRAVLMPTWWTPEKRFAWRWESTVDPVLGGVCHDWKEVPVYSRPQRVTASLETGEEVPA